MDKYMQELHGLKESFTKLVQVRQQLEAQYQENKILNEEFQNLKPETKIYRLIGPVMVPQDFDESTINVKNRIDFIEGERKRVDSQLEDIQKKMSDIQSKANELQSNQS
ncbi:hypothetical protein CANCADRAFT_31285 [Tortispora caseinolytica NRRL Y-17796]|uniref:Prefoldin subunit 6 n=1 Tax=Tortispora caseinolytica NRRL Y-17796 TaxID=767744 RepID=A0A1E4TES4_9ASCO|nr:hypothetical protein CANCADRAFT_31285 [Tortispora caseinolytica NRRL Y-17796]